jgi:hypothetical protein
MTLPAAAGAGGAVLINGINANVGGGNGGLVILTYSSPNGSCRL